MYIFRKRIKIVPEEAFRYNNIVDLNISENIVRIKKYAFANNSIIHLFIPDTVKMIEDYAFYYNPIISIKMSRNTILGKNAFHEGINIIYY